MKRKTKLILWLIIGTVLTLGPIWGMICTAFGMIQAFRDLAQSQSQPEVLAGNISLALHPTAAGWIACPIGIVIVIISVIKLSRSNNENQEMPSKEFESLARKNP